MQPDGNSEHQEKNRSREYAFARVTSPSCVMACTWKYFLERSTPTRTMAASEMSFMGYPFQLMNGLDIPILANLLRQSNRGSPFIFEKVKRAGSPSERKGSFATSALRTG
jgi:hypothetical protein